MTTTAPPAAPGYRTIATVPGNHPVIALDICGNDLIVITETIAWILRAGKWIAVNRMPEGMQ